MLQIDQAKLRAALAKRTESSAHLSRIHLKKIRIADGSATLKPEGARKALTIRSLTGLGSKKAT